MFRHAALLNVVRCGENVQEFAICDIYRIFFGKDMGYIVLFAFLEFYS